MSLDVAELFYKKYSKETSKDGKKFHETYPVDWSSKFVEATVSIEEKWMNRYDNPKDNIEADIRKLYDRADWHYLWEAAQEIKTKAGGIGVANIGQDAKWYDVGTIKELFRLYMLLVDNKNPELRNLYREIMGLPLDKRIHDSYIHANVAFDDKDSVLIDHSVFEKGGKVGRNCVIINSYFREYAEIPSNTVIIGSDLHEIDVQTHKDQNDNKMVYCVHKTKSFWFKNGVAMASVYFHDDEEERLGEFPIELTGKEKVKDADGQPVKDNILNHYQLNGKIKDQPIKGIGISIMDAKKLYSATKAKNAFDKLMQEIEKFLSQNGRTNE